MRRLSLAASMVLTLAAIAILAAPALAQPAAGRGSPISLLTFKDTAAELKLSDDEVKKFKELQDKRPKFNDGQEKLREWNKEVEKAVNGLKDEQKKRLDQLQVQYLGAVYFTRPDIQKKMGLVLNPDAVTELGIGDDDKKKLEEIAAAYLKAQHDLGIKDFMSEEYRKKLDELRKTYGEKFAAALPDEARKKYEELSGPAYKGEWPPQPRRPGG